MHFNINWVVCNLHTFILPGARVSIGITPLLHVCGSTFKRRLSAVQ